MVRGLNKTTLPGYVGFLQFVCNLHQLTAFEQAEMILYAALDPAVAGKARQGDFGRCLDHCKLLQKPDKLSKLAKRKKGDALETVVAGC